MPKKVWLDPEIDDVDPDELPTLLQFESCRAMWIEALRHYLRDCLSVWRYPERNHPREALSALNDLLTDMRQLRHLCDHLDDDLEPENIRTQFKRWIRK